MGSEIKGNIFLIKDTQKVNDKFQKREFVIVTEEKYPQHLQFQCVNDKCSILESFAEGQSVIVHYNLRGNKYTTNTGEVKYFVSLEAWKIEAHFDSTKPTQAPSQDNSTQDDLPF
jgi:predicted SnoaL-like aldol condensation-catalyzing enzyme